MADIPLNPLHSNATLVLSKLQYFSARSTEDLLQSLAPGQSNRLKVRPDGIIHGHRTSVLRARGMSVDDLPREIITKEEL